MIGHRVFHRLPTAALLSEGIAAVDSPWKTLLGRTEAVRFGHVPRPHQTLVGVPTNHQPIPAHASGA